jgi:adenine specific DNA methylase Mod
MLIPLGEKASVKDILDKLDILFSEVFDNGMIMQEFFNAFQKSDENATTLSCRLESMLQNAIDNGYLDRVVKTTSCIASSGLC